MVEHAQEWLCREHDVLWGAETDGRNPGCWVCGQPGDPRPVSGMRPSLSEWAGYGVVGGSNTVRRR